MALSSPGDFPGWSCLRSVPETEGSSLFFLGGGLRVFQRKFVDILFLCIMFFVSVYHSAICCKSRCYVVLSAFV